MVNQRRQSMQLTTAASPMPMQRAPSSRLASGMLETFSSLNSEENGDVNLDPELAEDEEFAAEEHAHRYVAHRTCRASQPQVQNLILIDDVTCCWMNKGTLTTHAEDNTDPISKIRIR